MKTVAVVAALVATTAAASAQGIVVVTRETGSGQPLTARIAMDATHVRAESRNGAEEMAFVYDGDAEAIRILNLTKKTYTEITRAQLDQMGQQRDAAMAAAMERMKDLPPERRRMMEEAMKRAQGGAAMPQTATVTTEYRRTGSGTVGQWACTTYDGFRGATKVAELCAAPPSVLGLSPSDFDATRQLAAFTRRMAPQAADGLMFDGTDQSQGFEGIPLRRTRFRNGKPAGTSEIVEVRREALPASTFAAPAGFRRESMPGAGRR
ncbi:MAG: hypothetical protein AB7P67_04225 [Vicinamibacterales bacterium]